MADIVGIVLAAGSARRMGENKMRMRIGAKSVIERSLEAFEKAGCFDRIVIVCRKRDHKSFSAIAERVFSVPFELVPGGEVRQQSVENALHAIGSADFVAVHDGARCFIDPAVIAKCVAQAQKSGAAAAGVKTKDTIKQLEGDIITGTLSRENLANIQTPQAFSFSLLMDAHRKARQDGFIGTDECILLERMGVPVSFVDAHYDNIKITTKEDILHGRHIVGEQTRTGIGYDAHRLQKGLPLVLGGVRIPHTHGLAGHSDADVLVHAIIDALLGAAALGDIGQHFPDTDDAYKDIRSIELLKSAMQHIEEAGFAVVNIDATLVMQAPKIAPYIPQMRQTIADALGVGIGQISIKATTTEGMGFEGTGEGISAFAAAALSGCLFSTACSAFFRNYIIMVQGNFKGAGYGFYSDRSKMAKKMGRHEALQLR